MATTINLQYLIDQAIQLAAGVGGDPHASPLDDSSFTAESLFSPVSRYVIDQLVKKGKFDECLQIHAIILTDEVGTLPANVLRDLIDYAYLPDFPYASKCLYFSDYNRQKFTSIIDYWAIQAGNIYFSGTLDGEETTRIVENCTIANGFDTLVAPVGTGGFLADISKRVVITVAAVEVLDTFLIAATDDDNAQMQDVSDQDTDEATATIYTTTGNALNLAAVSYPELPNNIDSAISISQTAADLIIVTMAAVLRGEISLAEISR